MRTRVLVLNLAAVAAICAGLATFQSYVGTAQATNSNRGPEFRVDPDWPKPLPNKWLVGQVAGVAVDRLDHIWIIQRQSTLTADEAGAEQIPPRSECCMRAPAVMQFDRAGNLLRAWGGAADPGFLTNRCTPAMGCEWPTNEHGIFVDHNDNVWIAGNGGGNHQVLKFSKDGNVPAPDRQGGDHRRQQRHQRCAERHAPPRPAGGCGGRPADERGVHRRRLPEQARTRR